MDILRKPNNENGVYQSITTKNTGWQWLNFEARKMIKGEEWSHDTLEDEMVIVLLSGNFKVSSNKGIWQTFNGRKDVFNGVAHTLYLPKNTRFTLTATSDHLDIGYGWCSAEHDFEPRFLTPSDTPIEIFGGDNATRQFNDLIPPGFPCNRIVVREVYTPSGNWSSFPAHKHDVRTVDDKGELLEPQQDETYFYKFQKPAGYAIQQVYTKESDNPKKHFDEIVRPRNNDVVVVLGGYHPVVAEHGFHCYYLNFLAGTDQSLANTTDTDHEWIYGSWSGKDKRLPLVTPKMNDNEDQ